MTVTTEQDSKAATPEFDKGRLDEFAQIALSRCENLVKEINALTATTSSDPQEVLESLRESYEDDAKVVKLREQISTLLSKVYELETARDDILKPVAEKMAAAAKETDTANTEAIQALHKSLNKYSTILVDEYGDDVKSILPKPARKRARGAVGETRRLRGLEVSVDGKVARSGEKQNSTLSAAALAINALHESDDNWVKVSAVPLQQAFFTAAGTEKAEDFPAVTEFEFAGHKVTVKSTKTEASE